MAKSKRAASKGNVKTKGSAKRRDGGRAKTVAPSASGAAATLLAALPALTDAQRNDLHAQFDDAECRERGAKTKAAQVANQALAWAADATKALHDPALAPQIDYAPFRLSWLLELVVALQGAGDRASTDGTATDVLHTQRDLARVKARNDRNRLVDKLSRAVKGSGRLAADLARARGDVQTDTALATSLTALASLVDAVLSGASATAAAAANVTAADAATARTDAAALTGSRDDVVLGGRAARSDSPEQNLLEGRILHELAFLRDAFAAAILRGVPVSALVPTPTLAHALARTHAHKAAPAPAPVVVPPASQSN